MVASGGQTSGSSVFKLTEDFSLRIDPAEPLAGRNVNFTLGGLSPWQQVTIEFFDALGRPVQWVTENDVRIVTTGGVPVTNSDVYTDGSGEVSWVRVGAQDREGVWTARITIDGETSRVTYTVSQLQLPTQDTETIGVELRRYEGSVTNTFYSSLVATTKAVDLQAHLAWVVEQLGEDLGVQSRQIPDIYLTGNSNLIPS